MSDNAWTTHLNTGDGNDCSMSLWLVPSMVTARGDRSFSWCTKLNALRRNVLNRWRSCDNMPCQTKAAHRDTTPWDRESCVDTVTGAVSSTRVPASPVM